MIKLNFCKFKISFAMLLFRLKRYINIKYKFKNQNLLFQLYNGYNGIYNNGTTHIAYTNCVPICVVIYSILRINQNILKYGSIIIYTKRNIHEYANKEYLVKPTIKYYTRTVIDTNDFIRSLNIKNIIFSQNEPRKYYHIYSTTQLYDYINNIKLQDDSTNLTILYYQNIRDFPIEHYFYYGIWIRKEINLLTFFIKNRLYLKHRITSLYMYNNLYECKIIIYYKGIKHISYFEDKWSELYSFVDNILMIIDRYIERKSIARLFKEIRSELDGIKNQQTQDCD